MQLTQFKATLVVAMLAIPAVCAAGNGNGAGTAQDDGEVTDEIIVKGEKSLSALRREVWDLEEDFYSRYNELNDDRDYDVKCFFETPTGTRVKNHVCRARFVTNAYSAGAGKKRFGSAMDARNDENSEVAVKTEIFQQKLEALIASDPELQAALAKYNNARAQFMEQLHASGNE